MVPRTEALAARQIWPQKPAAAPGQSQVAPLNAILAPTGKPVGTVNTGVIPEVRTVTSDELQKLNGQMLQGAIPVGKPGYPGSWYQRADGSFFGVRGGPTAPTIDVDDRTLPPGFKVHQA
jgi:hypothetical protein